MVEIIKILDQIVKELISLTLDLMTLASLVLMLLNIIRKNNSK